MAPDLVGGRGRTRRHPRGRVEAQAFFEDQARIAEAREVLGRRAATAEDRVEFPLKGVCSLGVLRQQVPGPDKGRSDRHMPGHPERHRLVAQLGRRHLLARRVITRG